MFEGNPQIPVGTCSRRQRRSMSDAPSRLLPEQVRSHRISACCRIWGAIHAPVGAKLACEGRDTVRQAHRAARLPTNSVKSLNRLLLLLHHDIAHPVAVGQRR
jgi:hypothetical protein